MSCGLLSSFFIVSFFFLVFGKTSFGQGCDSDGLSCLSCTDYQSCSGGFPSGKIISCKSGNVCADDGLKKCQVKLNCYALNECFQAGIFPDAMVDSNYFVCLSDGGSGFFKYDFTCQDEHFFDQSLLSCIPRSATGPVDIDSTTSLEETSPSSTDSPDPTSSPTSTSPTSPSSTTTSMTPTSTISTSPSTTTISTSPSTTTISTSPSTTTISTSPSTTTISTSPSTTTTSTSSSTTTTSTPSSTTTTTPPTPTSPSTQPTTTPSPKFVCTGPGIFPNPENCKIYYRCSTSMKVFTYICPGNSYFNENILKCSMKITPACQEQILKNSTSTVPPTTSTTTPATTLPTTSSPSTTSSTTPTTTTTLLTTPSTTTTLLTTPSTTTTLLTTPSTTVLPTTPKSPPFSCPMPGTFHNPSDCKTYYRCSTSGKVFLYVCPGATYFNEITKRCSLTITARCKSLIQG